MAQKKRPKRSWLKALLFYIFFPLIIWGLAFVIWLYWSDLTRLFANYGAKTKRAPNGGRGNEKTERSEMAPGKRPEEKILDEDRKRLEDILKQRQ